HQENAPMNFSNQAPQVPTGLPTDFSLAIPAGEPIRHILLGSPGGIRQTIHLLHNLRYVETSHWSPLIEISNNRLILTPSPGEVISMLTKRL
ncbi:MAG: hypothetical protein AAF808_04075, partial [Cyanobacteria bacterium P01_D01_bin.2]